MNYIRFITNALSKVMVTISPFGVFGQSVHIMPGGKMVMNGTVKLVLNNASFINDGNFAAESSTVIFTGNNSVATIGGTASTSFRNLFVQKSSGNILLNNNISSNGTVNMFTGNLLLNNHDLNLGSAGRILGETNTSRITSNNGGSVFVSRTFSANTALNPGNIGAELEIVDATGTKAGVFTIQRTHSVETLISGGQSIQRGYMITNTKNGVLSNVRLRFFYLDPELAGNDEASLSMFTRSGAGNFLIDIGKDDSNAAQNWVSKGGLTDVGFFTLSSQSGGAVFRTGNNRLNPAGTDEAFVNSSMARAYPNPTANRFTVELFSKETRKITIQLYDEAGQLLRQKEVNCVAGSNTLQWDIGNYPSGIYYLSFKNHPTKNIKIIKE
jgi:hypothetical protein